MIEYLVTAFFVAQPVTATALETSSTRAPGKTEAPRLRSPVEISSKRVSGSRNQAVFKGDVVVKHQTLDLRCDEMIASYNGPREVTRVECVGNVRAVDGDRTAKGERADFDVPTGVLVVTGNPEAEDPTTHLRGSEVRLTTGSKSSEYQVENAVVTLQSAPLKQPPRKGGGKDSAPQRNPAEISSKRVVGSRTQAVFTGDVVVKQRTLDLRCDKMIAHYNGPREVTRAECVGNVRAVDGDRTARGARADFDVPTGVLVVTGNPEARDPTTHLRGSEVRMTVGNSNFEVKDAVITVETAPLKEQQQRRKDGGKGNPGARPGSTDAGGTKQP
ncbi:LptA/OstA family protein [Vitiosangium sp. GDMCC 1.1324]|uniref:LptA/OstA family protein n=1 Tax=Vitiosangium sp. (strain GDMCC 1.1324) TaxID=2138576 RepID=UPI00130E8565|nr:LptA/OstA family protein [Vitiosangium sp. GDMCC 1.1324]